MQRWSPLQQIFKDYWTNMKFGLHSNLLSSLIEIQQCSPLLPCPSGPSDTAKRDNLLEISINILLYLIICCYIISKPKEWFPVQNIVRSKTSLIGLVIFPIISSDIFLFSTQHDVSIGNIQHFVISYIARSIYLYPQYLLIYSAIRHIVWMISLALSFRYFFVHLTHIRGYFFISFHKISYCMTLIFKTFRLTWLISVASRGNFLLLMKVTPACWSSSWGNKCEIEKWMWINGEGGEEMWKSKEKLNSGMLKVKFILRLIID